MKPEDRRHATRACDSDQSGVARKIADAVLELYGFGSSMKVNTRLRRALCQHLSTLIDSGKRDHETLLNEGIAFLRRQEIKKMR